MPERFNEILSRLRHEKGVSQREAAAALGVSQALLSHYEKAAREPGLPFLAQACEYYGVSADYLLGLSAYRRKIEFSEEELLRAGPFFEAALSLARAALSLGDEQARQRMASLLSAMLCSLADPGPTDGAASPELTDALIALRRAQLAPSLSGMDFTPPDELLQRTEEELSTLFNK